MSRITKPASFIPYGDLPRRDYDLVAMCQGPLDEILNNIGVRAKRRNVKSEGGPSRALALKLSAGRYAQVVSYDATSDSIEVFLEIVDEWAAFRSDLKEVSKSIGVPLQSFYWIASRAQIKWR